MNDKKYILTDETINIMDHTLHRIQAIKDFGNVKAGDLGGFVESEDNLSQIGTCWVYDEACVYEKARVFDEAKIHGKAHIYEKACVFGEAWIYAKARVFGEANVYNKAIVRSETCIYDKAHVYGKACIYGRTHIYGEARIYGEASVFDDARIYGKANVFGEARVYGEASIASQYNVLVMPNIGSRKGTTTFFKTKDDQIMVSCGCFKGTIDEFRKKVIRVHGTNMHGLAYQAAIEMAKKVIQTS